ncbi:hypothetical protein QNI19_37710 [Cytophagaceae bacterium DM2B3-1]|uniref:Uncharacterized protein n=1 Tax=Xanthocytophaga flava TaxID=3048013 RepID=A0ABT7CYC7_9BACT|nr:hypothetical protein [Xanthocytophaga flavus]MDJ1466793.1 hypothetical protein [Xanthocytophaga flavus]MDJ1498730.1 hypothetical protein [Xanthocytophaga flavus]
MIDYFTSLISQGYSFFLIWLIVFILLVKVYFDAYQKEAVTVLEAMNLLMAVCGLYVFYFWFHEAFTYFMSNPYSRYIFITHIKEPYGSVVWITAIVGSVLTQLFWIPKLRHNMVLSLFIWLSLHIEAILIFITSFFSDYLPSGWIMEPVSVGQQILSRVLYIGMVAGVYFFLWKRKKK